MIINAPIIESEGMIMADYNSNEEQNRVDREQDDSRTTDYLEETSAEIVNPMPFNTSVPVHNRTQTTNEEAKMDGERREQTQSNGRGIGITALIVSIISLFVMPIILGIVGIVIGFVARRRGAVALGSWAIALGALSIIIGIFIAPFF
jgi:lipopolysaccharide export LptBFGC system permease protein LptF